VPDEKVIVWVGTSLDDLGEFPRDACQDRGFQLEQVQLVHDPDHWKPMPSVGVGCREIRISTGDGIFRVFYVTQFGDEIYVLHCFTKKTQKTSKKISTPVSVGTQKLNACTNSGRGAHDERVG
jgi:phage-related protein